MINLDSKQSNRVRKFICYTLICLISLQSVLYASVSISNEVIAKTDNNEHCDKAKLNQANSVNKSAFKDETCCDHHANNFAHCNYCSQSASALIDAIRVSPVFRYCELSHLTDVDVNYPQPFLELFKPPI